MNKNTFITILVLLVITLIFQSVVSCERYRESNFTKAWSI